MAGNIAPVKFDIEFRIDNNPPILGNRQLLIQSCDYFYKLLTENPQKIIKLHDIPKAAFSVIVSIILADESFKLLHMTFCSHLSKMMPDLAQDVLSLAEKLQIPIIKKYLACLLVLNVDLANDLALLKIANANDFEELKEACFADIDLQAKEFIERELYLDLSLEMLLKILERDSFFVAEIDILIMCLKWWEKNKTDSLEYILARIRFALIDRKDLHTKIRPLKIVPDEQISKAIKTQESQGTEMPKRFKPISKPRNTIFPAVVHQGTVNTANNQIYARHEIGKKDSCILLELEDHFLINTINIMFYDKAAKYSYYVEVSNDNQRWKRIIDYTKYFCYDIQDLYFPPQPMKYIKIVGVGSSKNEKFFRVRIIHVSYMRDFCKTINNGVLEPYSLRCLLYSKVVDIEELNRPHNIHTVCIFAPKKIPIKYRVETSIDKENWEHALDKTVEKKDLTIVNGKTYIKFRFPPRICMYYRISELKM